MKRIIFLISLISLIGMEGHSQSDSSYTLQQCIDYALKNNVTVQNSEFDEYISKAQVGEFRALGLPQISGTASLMDNTHLRNSFLPNNPGFTFDPSQPTGETRVFQNVFQPRSSFDGSVGITQMIFNGSYFVGLQASKTVVDLSKKNTLINKTTTVENVTKAFYLVLITKERIEILNANIARIDTLRTQTKAMNDKGFVEKIDVDRIEVSYNNLLTEKQKFENAISLTTLLLKYQMGYDVNKDINLSGNVNDLNKEIVAKNESVNYNNRPEYKLLQTQLRVEGLNLKNKRMGYLPSLSLFANAGYTRSDRSVGTTLTNTMYYYDNWGVNLSVPIFSSFNKYYKVQQSKITIKKIENNIDYLEQGIELQVKQSEISLKNNLKTAESQKRNLDIANEVTRITKIKYEQGIGSNLEVITAESAFKEAQTNYYNAIYDVVVSQIDFLKATGTLYKE